MPGSISRRVTIGASALVPTAIADLPAWAKGVAPVCIVALGAGSIYVVGAGEDPAFVATAANKIEFFGAGGSRDIEVRSINGTSSSPASDPLELELWWVR